MNFILVTTLASLCLFACDVKALTRIEIQEDGQDLIVNFYNESYEPICIYSNFLHGVTFFNESQSEEVMVNSNIQAEFSLDEGIIIEKLSKKSATYPKFVFENYVNASVGYEYKIELFNCGLGHYFDAKKSGTEVIITSDKPTLFK